MSVDQFVDFQILVNNSGLTKQGFGLIAVVTHKNLFPGRSKLYSRTADMITDGFASTSPEVRCVSQILKQPTHPPRVLLIKATSSVVMTYVITVGAVINNEAYPLTIGGEGFAETLCTYTSDGSATNDEIVNGWVALLNAVASKNYTAAATGSVGSKALTITSNASPNWFYVTVDPANTDNIVMANTTVGTGIDTELDAIKAKDNSWYWIATLYNSQSYVLLVADWVEANKKLYFVDVNDTHSISTVLSGADDTLAALHGLSYTRTYYNYYDNQSFFFSAGLEGLLAPKNVGRWTAKGKTVIGVPAVNINDNHTANILARRGNSYTFEGGKNVTWEGQIANTSYGFVDVTINLDYISDTTIKTCLGVETANDIINYTDEDIAMVEGAIYSQVILDALSPSHKIMAPGNPDDPDNDPPPSIAFPRVADVDPSVRALRELPDGQLTFRLAGAVHKIFVVATVSF